MRSKPKTPRAERRGNGGLAVATLRKVAGPGWKLRKASSAGRPGSRPGRLGAARCQGPWVHRDPGVPRALGFSPGGADGEVKWNCKADPAPFQTIRAAQRWLNQRAEVG